jgi:hypothetical protein
MEASSNHAVICTQANTSHSVARVDSQRYHFVDGTLFHFNVLLYESKRFATRIAMSEVKGSGGSKPMQISQPSNQNQASPEQF